MHEIVRQARPTRREVWPRDKAVQHFKDIGESFKAELIASIPSRLAKTMAQYANIKVLPPPVPFPKSHTSLYWHERFHLDPGNKKFNGE